MTTKSFWIHYLKVGWPPRFLAALLMSLIYRLGQHFIGIRDIEWSEFVNLPVFVVLFLVLFATILDRFDPRRDER